jgi:hypothetical protein
LEEALARNDDEKCSPHVAVTDVAYPKTSRSLCRVETGKKQSMRLDDRCGRNFGSAGRTKSPVPSGSQEQVVAPRKLLLPLSISMWLFPPRFERLGEAFLGTWDSPPQNVWLAMVTRCDGLVLKMEDVDRRVYRRIGLFMVNVQKLSQTKFDFSKHPKLEMEII